MQEWHSQNTRTMEILNNFPISRHIMLSWQNSKCFLDCFITVKIFAKGNFVATITLTHIQTNAFFLQILVSCHWWPYLKVFATVTQFPGASIFVMIASMTCKCQQNPVYGVLKSYLALYLYSSIIREFRYCNTLQNNRKFQNRGMASLLHKFSKIKRGLNTYQETYK